MQCLRRSATYSRRKDHFMKSASFNGFSPEIQLLLLDHAQQQVSALPLIQRTSTGTLSSQSTKLYHCPSTVLSQWHLLSHTPQQCSLILPSHSPGHCHFIHSSRVHASAASSTAMVNNNPTQPLPWLKLLCLSYPFFTDSQSIPPTTVMINLLCDD